MRELKGWHVLVTMLAFFGVTIAVNVAMATYAITTFSGEDTASPYMKGLAYNQTIAARATQQHLGWSATIDARRQPKQEAVVEVTVRDHDGKAQNGLTLSLTLRRPIDAHLDRTVTMTAAGDGTYLANLGALARGQWDLVATGTSADGTTFEAERRVVLP
jgi:nitrogen fixation protein FixH